jgi:hypothetical protein
VPPDFGCGVAPPVAAAGVPLALAAVADTVGGAAGALGAQAASTTLPRPEATSPSAARRLSRMLAELFLILM